jgi:FkbM family methyltransferase
MTGEGALHGRTYFEAAGVALGEIYETFIDRLADRFMTQGDVVVDGGANTGRHTISFAKRVSPGGTVHAFEPLADLVADNLAWARIDQVADAVRYHPIGLSDVAGEASFLRNTTDVAFSSLHFAPPGMQTEPVRVRLDTLDAVLPDERVAFIKMDVEGAEYAAFRGGQALIRRSAPFIVFENALQWAGTCFGYARDDFFALFAGLELNLYDAFGRRFTASSWEDPDVGWYFCAFPAARMTEAEFVDFAGSFWREQSAAGAR